MEINEWEPRLHEGPLLRMLNRKDRGLFNEMKVDFYLEFLEKLREEYGERKLDYF